MGVLPWLLLVATVLPGATVAQSGESSEKGEGLVRPTEYQLRRHAMTEITYRRDGSYSERKLPPEEIERLQSDGTIPLIRGDGFFTADAFLRPSQLAPGESGELSVLVKLTGKTVVVFPESHIELKLSTDNGPLDFGTPRREPAAADQLQSRVRGKPVHDDYLLFRVPIQIAADAPHQNRRVKGSVELELHDWNGQYLGLFASALRRSVSIGPSKAKHMTSRTVTTGPAGSSASPERAAGNGQAQSDDRLNTQNDPGSSRQQGAHGDGRQAEQGRGPLVNPDVSVTGTLAIWGSVLGLVFLLVLLLALMARRK